MSEGLRDGGTMKPPHLAAVCPAVSRHPLPAAVALEVAKAAAGSLVRRQAFRLHHHHAGSRARRHVDHASSEPAPRQRHGAADRERLHRADHETGSCDGAVAAETPAALHNVQNCVKVMLTTNCVKDKIICGLGINQAALELAHITGTTGLVDQVGCSPPGRQPLIARTHAGSSAELEI